MRYRSGLGAWWEVWNGVWKSLDWKGLLRRSCWIYICGLVKKLYRYRKLWKYIRIGVTMIRA